MSSTLSRVRHIVAQQLDTDEKRIHDDADFVDDLGATRQELRAIFRDLEELRSIQYEFNIDIPARDESHITSVRSAVAYIESHI